MKINSRHMAMTFALSLPAMTMAHGISKGEEAARIRKGLQIAPVELDLQDKNRSLVGLGSYIVNGQGGCNDCHTNPSYKEGGDPFQGQPEQINTEGYMAGGRAFGPIISSNITPDSNGRPHGLTFAQFKQIMRTGREGDASSTPLQVMPWPVYKNMTTRDLRAIYEYLRAIPRVD